jgi:hypothetical protein
MFVAARSHTFASSRKPSTTRSLAETVACRGRSALAGVVGERGQRVMIGWPLRHVHVAKRRLRVPPLS